MIGCGSMAGHHLRIILAEFETTTFPVVCEPSPKADEATGELFEDAGRK
jgi:ornithine cyclodeaminase/alanine dehydrogenase-like protein (mu-crystallin family)